MNLNELNVALTSLVNSFNALQQNVEFDISMFGVVLGLATALAGYSLVKLAQDWTERAVSKRLEEVRSNLRQSIIDEYKRHVRGGMVLVPAGCTYSMPFETHLGRPIVFVNVLNMHDHHARTHYRTDVVDDRIIIENLSMEGLEVQYLVIQDVQFVIS